MCSPLHSQLFLIHLFMLTQVGVVSSLLLLCGVPLYEYTTVYPFVVDGHLGRCQVWAFVNNAAVHIIAGLWDVCVRVCVYVCV